MTTAFDILMGGIATPTGAPAPAPALPILEVVPMAEGYDYKPYQLDALKHVFRDPAKPYGYVGLDMGLGKTVVAGGIAASATAAGIRPTLIVLPPSLRTNMHRELGRFFPWLTTSVIQGRGPAEGYTLPDVDVLIMGDSSLSGQGRRAKNDTVVTSWVDFLGGRIGALVIDEAHRFKNKSGRTDSMVKLATGVEIVKDRYGHKRHQQVIGLNGLPVVPPTIRVPMSGTMTPNGRNAEIATQVSIMGNGAWNDIGGESRFWAHYNPKVDQFSRGNDNTAELHERLSSTWYFRRLRDDVEDLPNKGRAGIHLDGRGIAVREYGRVEADLIEYLKSKQDGRVSQGQERAKAIVKMNLLRRLAGIAKVRSIVDHVKDILEDGTEGVFIVAEHKEVMDELYDALRSFEPATVRGGMSDKDKDREVTAFITGETRVMIGQITAAGVGLTLHGDGRNRRVVIAQLPWTPAELKQAEDRLHRLGQTRDVIVEVALCAIEGRWTIDERLWGLLEGKNFSASTLQDGEGEYLLEGVLDGVLDSYRS